MQLCAKLFYLPHLLHLPLPLELLPPPVPLLLLLPPPLRVLLQDPTATLLRLQSVEAEQLLLVGGADFPAKIIFFIQTS